MNNEAPLPVPMWASFSRRCALLVVGVTVALPQVALSQSYAYVATAFGDTVTVLNTGTNEVVKVIASQGFPLAVAASRDGELVYVANTDTSTVSVIDTEPNEIVATISLPPHSAPQDLAVGADGSRLYVVSAGARTPRIAGTLFVIDTATGELEDTLSLPDDIAVAVRISPDGKFAYVVNAGTDSISVIDTETNTLRARVAVGRNPLALAFSPDGRYAYVGNAVSSTVSVVNTATGTVAATVPVSLGPRGIATAPDGAATYIANAYSNSVYVVDTATNTLIDAIFPVGEVRVGAQPSQLYGAAITPDGSRLYVANELLESVSAIDTTTNAVVARIAVAGSPRGIAIAARSVPSPTRRPPTPIPTVVVAPPTVRAPMESRVYVCNLYSPSISVINTATDAVVATIPITHGYPADVAFTPDGAFAYVATGTHVVVINAATNTFVTAIDLPDAAGAAAVAVSPDGATAYVGSSGQVFLIDTTTNTITGTIQGGNILSAIAFAPDGSTAYVADSGGFPVLVVDTAREVVTTTVPVSSAQGITVSPDNRHVYATAGNLIVFDTAAHTIAADVPAGADPRALALTPDGVFAYVTSDNDSLFIVDTRTRKIVGTIYPVPSPRDVAITADGAFAYTTNFSADMVTVIDLESRAVARTIAVGRFPGAIALASPPLTFCVGDCGDEHTVSVDELVRGVRIALGEMPLDACAQFDANGDGRAFINELVRGVDNALEGCPSPPATAIPTPTPTRTPAPGECGSVCDGRPCNGVCPDGNPRIGYCQSTGPDGCECDPFECPYPCVAVNPVTSPWDRSRQTITGYAVGANFGATVTITGGREVASGSVVSGTRFAIEVELNPGLNQLSVSSHRDYPPCSGVLRRDSQGRPLDVSVVLPTPTPGA